MKYFLSAFTIFCLFSGCKKDDAPENICPLNDSNLVGSYLPQSIKYKETSASAEKEILTDDTYYLPCQRDDLNIMNPNHTFTYTDAGVVCTPNGSGNGGNWSLSGTTITIGTQVSTVTAFDCNSLTVLIPNYRKPGDEATLVFKRVQ